METNEAVKNHEVCIEILECIQTCDKMIKIREENIILGYLYNFPELIKRANHEITIKNMVIERLRQRYDKIIKRLYGTD